MQLAQLLLHTCTLVVHAGVTFNLVGAQSSRQRILPNSASPANCQICLEAVTEADSRTLVPETNARNIATRFGAEILNITKQVLARTPDSYDRGISRINKSSLQAIIREAKLLFPAASAGIDERLLQDWHIYRIASNYLGQQAPVGGSDGCWHVGVTGFTSSYDWTGFTLSFSRLRTDAKWCPTGDGSRAYVVYKCLRVQGGGAGYNVVRGCLRLLREGARTQEMKQVPVFAQQRLRTWGYGGGVHMGSSGTTVVALQEGCFERPEIENNNVFYGCVTSGWGSGSVSWLRQELTPTDGSPPWAVGTEIGQWMAAVPGRRPFIDSTSLAFFQARLANSTSTCVPIRP